jgi:hypothetical protein
MSRAASLWYAALVRLFPTSFREAFGAEMTAVILEQRANLPGSGRRRWGFHAAATVDLLRAAGREWRPALLRLSGGLVLVAAMTNIGYDIANPKLSMGVPAWAITVFAIGWGALMAGAPDRRRRPG